MLRRIPPCPAVLAHADSAGVAEREAAIAHFTTPGWQAKEAAKSTSFTFQAYRHPDVRAALNEAFEYTCAYCESPYPATQPVDVEHYRPKGGIRTGVARGTLGKPGYFWLASTWDNLLPACARCNRTEEHVHIDGSRRVSGKGNWFPVENERRRATQPDTEGDERPLLLHPYHDDPDEHLEFVDEGVLRPRRDGTGRDVSAPREMRPSLRSGSTADISLR